jgi:hypothetical protein
MKDPKRAKTLRIVLGLILLVQFILTLVILLTDHNLQTDFGIYPKYFIHWYGLLVTGIIDIIGFALLVSINSRRLVAAGVGWSAFMVLFQIADLATYKEVGFNSVSQFATYLFGFSKYPGSLSYIPGLYDILLAIYVIALIVGVLGMMASRPE